MYSTLFLLALPHILPLRSVLQVASFPVQAVQFAVFGCEPPGFAALARERGTFFAFHGSAVHNWCAAARWRCGWSVADNRTAASSLMQYVVGSAAEEPRILS